LKVWFVGVPAAVVASAAVALFVARETAPAAVVAPPPVAAAEPEVPIATRIDGECVKIVGDGTDLDSRQAPVQCKIDLLSRYLSEAKMRRMDDAYHRVFK
jgi:hypothetical protein